MPANSSRLIYLVLIAAFFVPVHGVAQDDDYELMKLFVETFEQVETNYVREVDRRELMEAAIQGMLHHLDPYSSFIPPNDFTRFNQMVEQEFGGIGITINARNGTFTVVSPLPGSPAYRAGIRSGDRIVGIEGERCEGLTVTQAVKKLQGPVGRPVSVTVMRDNDESYPKDVSLIRELIKAPTVRGDRYDENAEWQFMLEGEPKIGYVRLSNFSRFTAQEVKTAVDGLVEQGVEGLVLDLRFNPGGLLESAVELADMFLEEGNIVSVRGRNVPDRSWAARKTDTYPMFPMAVLVNGYSASASEVLSACLQDNHRAVVIGERTWGKGSVQNVIHMEDGRSALKLTTAGYHRPSGVNIHRFPRMTKDDQWGVTPDNGYNFPYTQAEWRRWDAERAKRDVLHIDSKSVPAEETETSDDAPFDDIHLTKALEYIKSQLDAPVEQPPGTNDEATAE